MSHAICASVWAFSGNERGSGKIGPEPGNAPGVSRLSPPQPCRVLQTFDSHACMISLPELWLGCVSGRFNQGVSKQGVPPFAWRPTTLRVDTVLASDCRAQFARALARSVGEL